MERSEYPTLQPADILKHCRMSLGMGFVTEELILRPTAEAARAMYSAFLATAFGPAREGADVPDFQELSAPSVMLFHRLRDVIARLSCKDIFRIGDILAPDPKRARRFFSSFINFLKFRTDEEIFYEHMSDQQAIGLALAEFSKARDEIASVRGEVEKLQSKIEAQRPIVQEKEDAIEKLKASKVAAEKVYSKLTAEVEDLSKQVDNSVEALTEVKRRTAEREGELEKLKSMVTSPESTLQALTHAKERLETENLQHVELDLRWRTMEHKREVHADVFLKLKAARSLFDLLSYSKRQVTEVKRRIAAAEESLQAETRAAELISMRLAAAQRTLATSSHQGTRDKEAGEARLQNFNHMHKARTEEVASQKALLHERSVTLQRIQRAISDIELRREREEAEFTKKYQRCTSIFVQLSRGVDSYLSWLQSPDHFGALGLSRENTDEWPVRLGNLQKLQAALVLYLHSLGLAHLHEQVDLLAIAVNKQSNRIAKLLEEVMCAAIHCRQKETFITSMKSLSENTQLALMNFIQKVLAKGERNPMALKVMPTHSELEMQLQSVKNERDLVTKEKARIEQENIELQMTNTDLQSALFIRPKRRNLTPDSIALQLEVELTNKERKLCELTQAQATQQRAHANALAALRDELEQAQEKLQSVPQLEETIAKQKQVIDELLPLKAENKGLKEENELLSRRLQKAEAEDVSLQSYAKQIAQLREQVTKEKMRVHGLEDIVSQREQQVKDLSKSEADALEKLRVSESKCKELSAQVDRLLAENNSEDSFCTRNSIDSRATARRDTLTALMMAEGGIIPRQVSGEMSDMKERKMREFFILTFENAELKAEKEKLTQDLAEVTHKFQVGSAEENARFAAVSQVYEQEIHSLKESVKVSEAALREARKSYFEEVAGLTASARTLELQLETLQSEVVSLKAERESLAQDLSKSYHDKDDLMRKYLTCRDETLHLHRELSDKAIKVAALEQEIKLYKARIGDMEGKEQDADSVLALQIENLEIERKTYSLKSRISELEYQVKDKEEWVQKVAVEEAQIKELQERLARSKADTAKRDAQLSVLKREKEELFTALSKERRLMKDVLVEVNGTMTEIHGLVDVRSSNVS